MNLLVANDNGNSEQKIIINGDYYRQPNVYQVYNIDSIEVQPIENVMKHLMNNIIVTIDSKAVSNQATTYVIGRRALELFNKVRNMNISRGKKHKESLPVINTLGTLAAYATKAHYEESGSLEDGEVIELTVDMTTALPASVFDEYTKQEFSGRFTENYHEVKVHFNNTHATVKLKFEDVKVVAEGVPAIFNIIQDGNGGYRKDNLFDDFMATYNKEGIDGSYFSNKRLLHVDIGDGTTELTFTKGYEHDRGKSEGLDFGLGEALETSLPAFQREMEEYDLKVSRQDLSKYLKDEEDPFHELAKVCTEPNLNQLAEDLEREIRNRTSELKLEFDVIVVYGGASISLKSALHDRLVEHFRKIKKEILWIPADEAVDMNVKGMDIYNQIVQLQKQKQ